jgi:hypothetical protein
METTIESQPFADVWIVEWMEGEYSLLLFSVLVYFATIPFFLRFQDEVVLYSTDFKEDLNCQVIDTPAFESVFFHFLIPIQ